VATRIESIAARRRPSRYPLDQWLNGDTWMIRRGVDFDGLPSSIERLIRYHAAQRDLTARVSLGHDGESVEFTCKPAGRVDAAAQDAA
jgi:hypothetical protein